MAKGNIAKKQLIENIIKLLPKGVYIGEFDKKHYFWSEENGEKIQIAISMTCPKNQVTNVTVPVDGGLSFSNESVIVAPATFEPVEITEAEKETVAELMTRLGL